MPSSPYRFSKTQGVDPSLTIFLPELRLNLDHWRARNIFEINKSGKPCPTYANEAIGPAYGKSDAPGAKFPTTE